MLSEFGETEVLWMDSIRTHCYVIVGLIVNLSVPFCRQAITRHDWTYYFIKHTHQQ
ncbi:hypothetical protein BCR41DRAFT_361739, partial [Lobosporangium transversale]